MSEGLQSNSSDLVTADGENEWEYRNLETGSGRENVKSVTWCLELEEEDQSIRPGRTVPGNEGEGAGGSPSPLRE